MPFCFGSFFIEKLHSGSYSILISQQLINGRYNILHMDPNSLSECYSLIETWNVEMWLWNGE